MKIITPIPDNAPGLPKKRSIPIKDASGNITDWHHYDITHCWPYHTVDGKISHYVVRYTNADGEKETPPMTLQETNGKLKWGFKGIEGERILFNLHLLTKYPNAQVLVVEGEKKADTAFKLFSENNKLSSIIPIGWEGGCGNVDKSDWTPLKNRIVILWPDNDLKNDKKTGKLLPMEKQCGYVAMLKVASFLDNPKKTKIVTPDQTKPDTWDIADAILNDNWSFQDIYEFIVKNVTKLPENLPVNTTEKPKIEIAVPLTPEEVEDTGAPFSMLGHDKGVLYFLPHRAMQIFDMSIDGAASQAKLMWLADLTYWERYYPGKNGPNWKMATNTLFNVATRKGLFNMNTVRGRGGWIDDGRRVIHTGDKLIVDGKTEALHKFKSKFTYCQAFNLEHDNISPLKNDEAIKFLELCKLLPWERPIHTFLFAGWCVAAPICGAMPWRPHVWLTGESGVGKSWILEHVVKRALGQWAKFVQSNTTEAALRQMLHIDALPVMFDEFESEDWDATTRVRKILELSRQASSDSGAVIAKGGADGEALLFMIRSMFMFSSVNTLLSKQSDISRITTLNLKYKFSATKEELYHNFHNIIKPFSRDIITEEYCARLRSRTFSLMSVIGSNYEVFREAASDVLGTQRAGDQIGALLAAAYSLTSSNPISLKNALEWVEMQDWQEEKHNAENTDAVQCLNAILQGVIRIEERHESLSISELIMKVSRPIPEAIVEPYDNALKRIGIKAKIDEVVISDSYDAIKNILKNSSFMNSWGRVLKRLPEATKRTGERFLDGVKTQATAIPIYVVFRD